MRASFLVVAVALVLPALWPATAAALPTPGLFCEPAQMVAGRYFPEPEMTNDFIGLDEGICGLLALEKEFPDRIEVLEVGRSVGWRNMLTQTHDTLPVYAIEVTNEASPLPREAKATLLFQLSIHGNEKDGREGGLRVIEDLVRGIGVAKDHPHLLDLLDRELLVFLLPNPDGWAHEDLEYRGNPACSIPQLCAAPVTAENFVRVNGAGKDLNRNWPTIGWMPEQYTPFSEPEILGTYAYLESLTNLRFATDIHGMLNPADGQFGVEPLDRVAGGGPRSDKARGHFLLGLVAAGQMDAAQWHRVIELSERIKGYVNADPKLAPWYSLPTTGVWGGDAMEWGMSVDAIDYEDGGFTGDFFVQRLRAPDIDFEMAYNHILMDNYYPIAAQVVNAMAVASVRQITRAMMELGALDTALALDAKGTRTLVLENPVVVTGDAPLATKGWAKENPLDDAFEPAARPFRAAPSDYWRDLAPFLAQPDQLVLVPGRDLPPLAGHDRIVVPGSAARDLTEADRKALVDWTRAGGRLVLTDAALTLLETVGAAKPGSVEMALAYTGAVDLVDREHPLAAGVRGLARQTYVAVPMGYPISQEGHAPNWFVRADGFDGDVVGLVGYDPARVSLGEAKVGEGTVVFLGAALPDPSVEAYHPYGLASYAATYTTNRILLNALGWGSTASEADWGATPASATADAGAPPASVPGAPFALLVAALALVAFARRRA